MLLKFKILENKLSTRQDAKFVPRTVLNGSLSDERLIQSICWGSTITPSDCKAVLENLERVVTENLASGLSVNLGFINLKPTIKGTFERLDEPFTPGKHKIRVTAVPSGTLLQKVTLSASPSRVVGSIPSPEVFSFYNSTLERENVVRSGDLITIRGNRLKFDKASPDQGVFFLSATGNAIRATEYSIISSVQLVFKAPQGLIPNEMSLLEVRTELSSGLRTGRYKESLEVIA